MIVPWHLLSGEEQLRLLVGRGRLALPAIAGLAAALVATAPIFTPAPVLPHFALLLVLVWSLYQPSLMPPFAALVIGIAADIALALPLGVNATLLPVLALLVRRLGKRTGERAFAFDWLLALPIILVYQIASWQLMAFVGQHHALAGLLPQALSSALAFPLVARASAWMHRRFLES